MLFQELKLLILFWCKHLSKNNLRLVELDDYSANIL